VQRTAISVNMSVVYEPRSFIHDGGYPPMDDHHDSPDADRFTDPTDAVVNELATTVATFTAPHSQFVEATEPRLDLPVGPPPATTTTVTKEDSPIATTPQQRIKAIPKPDREVTRNLEGRFICTWPGCAEEPKEFIRKCEWK
jgi:hypothetical protein